MIVGVGIDAVGVARMRLALERTPGVAGRLFTPAELETAASRGSREASLAARFAAKEACRKALAQPLPWREMEVVSLDSGAPRLEVAGRSDLDFHLSLSHTRELAVAVVVAESR